ncbi:glycerol-3-phosphate acyltransferase [Anopheles sinensis]|uniref:Glycerol-3-phosphate acyltransferase n=1 Tax=Anopheles sinensis TaxID=74873 RepID=A0A084VPE6_ANOSI|nr:glycerol-3-phosphate acyltransferase [Anopheles sinensis]
MHSQLKEMHFRLDFVGVRGKIDSACGKFYAVRETERNTLALPLCQLNRTRLRARLASGFESSGSSGQHSNDLVHHEMGSSPRSGEQKQRSGETRVHATCSSWRTVEIRECCRSDRACVRDGISIILIMFRNGMENSQPGPTNALFNQRIGTSKDFSRSPPGKLEEMLLMAAIKIFPYDHHRKGRKWRNTASGGLEGISDRFDFLFPRFGAQQLVGKFSTELRPMRCWRHRDASIFPRALTCVPQLVRSAEKSWRHRGGHGVLKVDRGGKRRDSQQLKSKL